MLAVLLFNIECLALNATCCCTTTQQQQSRHTMQGSED
jgi:hypothetical protein